MRNRSGSLWLAVAVAALSTAGGAFAAPPAHPQRWLSPLPLALGTPVMVDVPAGATSVGGIWAERIGGTKDDTARVIRATSDSGFVFAGSTFSAVPDMEKLWLFKTDAAGVKLWEKIIGSGPTTNDYGGVVPLSDGGYAAWVASSDATGPVATTIGKLDANTDPVWQKKFSGSGKPPDLVYIFADGSFLATRSTVTFVPPSTIESTEDLIRVSSAGSILWQKTLQPGLTGLGFPTLQSDGKLLFLGESTTEAAPGNFDGTVLLLDTNGTPLWQKTYAGSGTDFFYGAMPVTGGWLLYGVTTSWGAGGTTGDIWLVKIDGSGNIVSQKTIGDTNSDFGVPELLGGTLYLAGSTTTAAVPNGGGFLARLDSNYNVTWARVFSVPNEQARLFAIDDGGGTFLLEGGVNSGNGTADIILGKADSNGTPIWGRRIGGPDEDSGFAFREGSAVFFPGAPSATSLTDANLILAGSTKSFGAGGTDVLFARLDPTGQLPGCSFVQDVTITSTPWTPLTGPTTATVTSSVPTTTTPTWSLVAGTLTGASGSSTTGAICNVGPVLTATATADKTSGTAPVTVGFTGSAANGTAPYTYDWDFGDGTAHSTQQNPFHVYNDSGSFTVTLTVTDAASKTAIDNHLQITVSGGTCTVGCTATVPATGTAGVAVAFASTASPSNCAGSPTYAWTFGDGSTSTSQNPSHTYAAAGTYNWSLAVTAGTGNCNKNGSITISGGAAQSVWWVPSIAHLPGAGGSKWRSNIAAVNRSGSTANLTLVFVPYASGANVTKTYNLPNGATVEWADVLVSLFAFADSANTKGTVKITSNVPIFAISRTYNQAASGTFGQYYPALVASQGITGSQAAVLPLLKKSTAFRTNAGFQNLGTSSCTGEIKLLNATGAQVGSTRTLTAAADKYIQEDDIFTKAGAGNQEPAYARVQATTPGCKAWFFASVVDSITNDPTTVPQQLSVAGPYWVPSIAHLPGAGGSKWRSNIGAVNRSGSAANLTLVFTPYGAGATVTKTLTLANNNTIEWADVLVSLFGFADSANTKGTVKITSNVPIFALSRTYNQAVSGTFGQYYPALVASQSITNGQTAVLPLLKKNSSFRTNTGFENVGVASCTGTFKLFNAAGVQVGSTRTLTAAADKYIQDDDVFTKAGAGNQEPAYAVVEVTTVGGKAWFFGSVVDAITNDPTTIPQLQ